MNTKYIRQIAIALCTFGLLSVAKGSTVLVGVDTNDPTVGVYSVVSATADGVSMASNGMQVIVNFANGGSQLVNWTAPNSASCLTANGCGLATGAVPVVGGLGGNWTLTESHDTGFDFGGPFNAWTLTNDSTTNAIVSVVLKGNLQVVFDRDRQTGTGADSGTHQIGTPGSDFGITYQFGHAEAQGANTTNIFTANVTYSNLVFINGSAPASCIGTTFNTAGHTTGTGCGDLWDTVTFTLTGGTGGFVGTTGPAVWSFFQDTDLVGTPEPATFGFAGLALAGLFGYRMRRRASQTK